MSNDRIYTILSRKLSGEATAAELQELDELVTNFPDSQVPLQIIERFWHTPIENDKEYLEATYHLHAQKLKENGFDLEIDKGDIAETVDDKPLHKRAGITRYLLMALTVTAITGVIIFFYARPQPTHPLNNSAVVAQSEVSTKNGSRTKIQLPDGTSVWLNGNSRLIYDNQHFGEIFREVTLVGEGYFDVSKNKEKPFIIHTAQMDIKVIGTAFNVQCYPDEKNAETSLIRGSIEVTLKNRKGKIILKPSEKLVVSNEDSIGENTRLNKYRKVAETSGIEPMITLAHLTHNIDNDIIETAWVQNKLVFSSETFEEVAFKMEKWYGMHISFIGEKLKTEKLTGSFEKETISEALKALQFTTRFKFKITNDTIFISN